MRHLYIQVLCHEAVGATPPDAANSLLASSHFDYSTMIFCLSIIKPAGGTGGF